MTLRQAWGLDDAETAEKLPRNFARRLEQIAPGVAGSILEGINEILTVIRRRSCAARLPTPTSSGR